MWMAISAKENRLVTRLHDEAVLVFSRGFVDELDYL